MTAPPRRATWLAAATSLVAAVILLGAAAPKMRAFSRAELGKPCDPRAARQVCHLGQRCVRHGGGATCELPCESQRECPGELRCRTSEKPHICVPKK